MKSAALFTVWFAFCASTFALNHEAMREALPVFTVAEHADLLNNSRCRMEIEEFLDAVDGHILWALRMLDSSGEPDSGYTTGSNNWLGKRDQCQYLSERRTMPLSPKVLRNNSLYRDPNQEYPPFQLHYFVARFIQNSTMQYHVELPDDDLVLLGLCLPTSCTKGDVGIMLERVFSDRTLLTSQLYSADFKLVEVSDMRDDHQWLLSGKIITIILILASTLSMVIAGTLYDLLVYQKCLRKKKEFLAFENNNTSELKNDAEEKREADPEEAMLTDLRPKSGIGHFLMCFSAYSNLKSIFHTSPNSDSIPAIHGIKFFGMMWVILAHSVFYNLYALDNKSTTFHMVALFAVQIMANATLSVDTFFFLSGFLLTYVYLKNKKKEVNSSCNFGTSTQQWIALVIKRYIRLTPVYAFAILVAILNFTWYEKVSIFHFTEQAHVKCSKYWWRNLLYINNLYEWDSMCLTWTWYLANDMQFFMLGCFLLLMSSAYYYISLGIAAAAVIMSVLSNIYTTYSIDYVPTLDEMYKAMTLLYEPPWVRISPYLIGMATAVLLFKWNFKLHLSKRVLIICWCCGIICNCSILFGLVNNNLPIGWSVLYVGLGRTGWGCGIAWFIIACSTNNAGIVNDFLSLNVWVPLSKLTYCAYLLNPIIISSVAQFSNYSSNFSFLPTGCYALGVVFVSYFCAIGLCLWIEMPSIKLLRTYLNPNRRTK